MKEVFTKIYNDNTWMSKESVSGEGSELRTTIEIRERLPMLFEKYCIKRLLDLGCGDFNWMKEVVGDLDYYYGVDVVEAIVKNNKKKYESYKVYFDCKDLTEIDTSENFFDAVIIRDVLVHFSFIDIKKVLNNLSNVTYLFTTSFLEETNNRDIPTGSWRRLNFQLPPFNFDAPLESIISYSEPYNDANGKRCQDKTLSMWKL